MAQKQAQKQELCGVELCVAQKQEQPQTVSPTTAAAWALERLPAYTHLRPSAVMTGSSPIMILWYLACNNGKAHKHREKHTQTYQSSYGGRER